MNQAPPDPRAVLDFWFSARARKRWFSSTPAFDRELERRFGGLVGRAARGELADWEHSASGALALVVLLDQLPLNIFRDRPEAFATERAALAVAGRAVDRGLDAELDDAGKAFLYMPFMHSEELADQERSVALFAAAGLADNLKWARHHREIVRRFGRFPHRNAILGRDSSAEEIAWLQSDEAFSG